MAMKATDLMIGDLVYIHEPECKGHRIDSIDELDGQVGADGEVYDECDIRPIPLTEEILVKNGFKKQEDVNEWSYYKSKDGKGQYMILWSMDYNYLEIGSYTEEFGEFNRLGVMRYVHQLQHALRLCGVEKEIEL
jgi:hypothetical protein